MPVLVEFLDKYRMLQMLFWVCIEQRVINERQYAGFALLLEKIGKQATAWKQYNEKGEKKKARIVFVGVSPAGQGLPERAGLLKKGYRQALPHVCGSS